MKLTPKEILRQISIRLKKADELQAIKEISIFSGLKQFELDQVKEYIHLRKFDAGETIFEKGYPIDAIYFVKEGDIRLKLDNKDKEDRILQPGKYIGIVDLFNDQKRSSLAIAETDAQLYAISKADLLDLIQKEKKIGVKILLATCRYISALFLQERDTEVDARQ